MDAIKKQQTAVEWLIEQLTPSISLQQKHIDNLKAEAKEKEKGQIVDAIVCYFQVNDKTPYGMEYLSKLDNAISDALIYYVKTYEMKKQKSFVEKIDSFKEKHGAIFENKSYNELKEKYHNTITLNQLLDEYVEKSEYGMDMWSKEENDTMSKIIEILKQNKILQDESK